VTVYPALYHGLLPFLADIALEERGRRISLLYVLLSYPALFLLASGSVLTIGGMK
jgi:hypothetical protein